jgi:DNA-directed RNA polymerase subunit H (RpoH/RPB5)
MAPETTEKQFDITKHRLVPFHETISEKEREEIFKKYNIKQDQLPRILDTDPVAIAIGAKPGQIVKITRKSQTAKQAVAYRLVVEGNKVL